MTSFQGALLPWAPFSHGSHGVVPSQDCQNGMVMMMISDDDDDDDDVAAQRGVKAKTS